MFFFERGDFVQYFLEINRFASPVSDLYITAQNRKKLTEHLPVSPNFTNFEAGKLTNQNNNDKNKRR